MHAVSSVLKKNGNFICRGTGGTGDYQLQPNKVHAQGQNACVLLYVQARFKYKGWSMMEEESVWREKQELGRRKTKYFIFSPAQTLCLTMYTYVYMV